MPSQGRFAMEAWETDQSCDFWDCCVRILFSLVCLCRLRTLTALSNPKHLKPTPLPPHPGNPSRARVRQHSHTDCSVSVSKLCISSSSYANYELLKSMSCLSSIPSRLRIQHLIPVAFENS